MKIKLFLIILVISAIGCEKHKNENCLVTKTVSYFNGTPNGIYNYDYDDQRRVKTITNNQGFTVSFQYFKDSVVSEQLNGRTVYYLNSAGRADSARVRYTNNPNQLALDHKYTHDAEGFLTEERTIFSQLYNGAIIRDTTYDRYTIANGNIIKWQSTGATSDISYEYSSQAATSFLVNNGQLPFLGKSSKNLVAKTLDNGVVLSVFTYQFDGNGNVTKSTESYPGGGAVTDFTYNCN